MNENVALKSKELAPLVLPTFSIRHAEEGQELVVTLVGNADSEVGAPFAVYLEQLHGHVVSRGLRKLVFDFRELYFLTSSCIKHFVVTIKRASAMDPAVQYKIELLTTPKLRWQERSFEVLCQIAPSLVSKTSD